MIGTWLQGLAAAAPSRCAVCGAWPAEPVCAACEARFRLPQPRCGRCAGVVAPGVATCGACLRQPPPLDACLAAVPYAYPWSELVWRFKFREQPGWATSLAALVRATPGVPALLEATQLVVPVPLARERLAERGFNQALELARGLAPERTAANLLLRLRLTQPQASLAKKDRQANVAGAFAVDPLRVAEVQGRHVLLVDDVMTSGASLHACALALRAAGASWVGAVVLARADEAIAN
jgi:ComF family protein